MNTDKLVQLMGDHFEVWRFPVDITKEQIKEFYRIFDEFDHNAQNFQDYMKTYHKDVECERVFVEEIWLP